MIDLLEQVRSCRVCQDQLEHVPNPVVQFHSQAKVIIIGQAPGRRVHQTGIPWNDASGRKLRDWLGVADEQFYNPHLFSILPMAFCYPGKGKSGDLPPMPECARLWHSRFFTAFSQDALILLVGQYSQRYYLRNIFKGNLTDTVKSYVEYLPRYFPLPHPSPRNQHWLKLNPWFSRDVLPHLKSAIQGSLANRLHP